MYIWNIEQLKKDILGEGVSEFNSFIYFMIYIVFSLVVLDVISIWPSEPNNSWDIIGTIGSTVLGIVGTVIMFILNGGKSGNAFLVKYFSIGFVATVRYFVFTIPLLIIPFIYTLSTITAESDISTTPAETFVLFVWEVGMYWYICKHISDVKNS